MIDLISESTLRLKSYIEKENYRGYDPYDALLSPLFNLPLIRNSRDIRFLSQQFIKRVPFNLRSALFIKKGLNPVTLGLCISGYLDLCKSGLISIDEAESKCGGLLDKLDQLIPTGFSGACWGYDFPWQSRHFTLGPFQPSIVATGIITHALFRYYEFSKNMKAFGLCRSSCDFILNDLNRYEDADGSICFSYTPFDRYRVYNASLKGVRTLAQVYSVNKESRLFDFASKGADFVAKNQKPDGSWPYAPGNKGKWIDNYHTGYVLDCLDEYALRTGDSSWKTQVDKGFDFYVSEFFEDHCIPKFYNHETYPIDCTSAAQSILTLCRFGNTKKAEQVAEFMINNMQGESGSFYFRKYRYMTDKTPFMRWSNAWMFNALSSLLTIINSRNSVSNY